MKHVIDVGLPTPPQPFSWAVASAGMLFTAHGPVLPDGRVDTGPVARQARLTLENLRQAVRAAGGDLEHVTQVQLFLTDAADMPVVDEVYREFFAAEYPNRCTAVVAALVVSGMRVELTAHAVLPGKVCCCPGGCSPGSD